ncbi:MAG TPA: glycolate oxidase subunit GlcF [Methylocystis sp.]|nr:glycolate oxidase subunit GlcF [Methylocystis sp.]
MQTSFSLAALADPDTARAEKILRACVHCGFCTATCPTYLETGDELDSPRGRIYLIKEMLENARDGDARTARHLDRCLTCLSCMTTCPSGVDYRHLVDHARLHIERTFARPAPQRALRALLAHVIARPDLFRLALRSAALARPFAALLPKSLRAMLELAPARLPPPSPVDRPQSFPAQGRRRMRVALLSGCAQTVLDANINAATVRLLTRLGVEVVVVPGVSCCGALPHHLGRDAEARAFARRNIAAWMREIGAPGLDAIVANASGCGAHLRDYGHLFQDDAELAAPAAQISARVRDVSELVAALDYAPKGPPPALTIAYHSACTLGHGQKITSEPLALLRAAGFAATLVPESHICCGSAGTYNLLQPELAAALRRRKVENLESLEPDAIAAGNIGCITQIRSGTQIPVAHVVELLDWASGGPRPPALEAISHPANAVREARAAPA